MALADDIRALRDRALAELDAAADFLAHTQFAWSVVHGLVRKGRKFGVRTLRTGTVVDQDALAARAHTYAAEQVAETALQQFLAVFEAFFFDLLRLWLVRYPGSLVGKNVGFRDVLDAVDKDAIVQQVVEREINEVAYKRPADWFAYLETKAKLGCPTADEIARIAEAKASRDALLHGRGIVGKAYAAKAGDLARFKDGERIDVPEAYIAATWQLLRKVVAELGDAALAKAS